MKFLGVVHSSAQKAAPLLAPYLDLRPIEGLGGATPDVIVSDFASLTAEELQQILKFLPQQPLFVHTGAEDRRPVYATHGLNPEGPLDGQRWEAGKVFLDAATRRAATSPFDFETFFTDLLTLPSGLLGMRKGGHEYVFFFRDGHLVYFKNSESPLALGQILVQKQGVEAQKEVGLPRGPALEKVPALGHDRVRTALREQAELMLKKMASPGMAVELKHAFPLPPGPWEPLPLQRIELVSAFLRNLTRWPGEVPMCVHPETEVQAAGRPESFTALALTPSQFFLLQQATAPIALRTLFSVAPGTLFDKEKDVFLLISARALRVAKAVKRTTPFDEAVQLARGLSKLTLYQVLGVREEATPDQIRTAYFDLAKKFHPDKFSRYPDYARHARVLEDLFATINEAYQVLTNPEEKAKYNRRLQEGKSLTVDVREKSRALTAEARTAIQQKQYGAAIQKLNEVVYLKQADAKTYLLLAQCLLKDPDRIKEAEIALKKSMEMEPNDADAHYTLGLVYLQARLKGRAAKAFQRALELNPAHLDAEQQLKQIE
jgi:tetratricopeptide (TPR) repeat protein